MEIKQVYSRRTRREKILSAGVLVMGVLVMLLLAARCSKMPQTAGIVPTRIQNAVLWLFAEDVQMTAMAVYLVGALPTILISAAVLDEIGQKKGELALPFYFYPAAFMVEKLFYNPLSISVCSWIVLVLTSFCLYEVVVKQYKIGCGIAAIVLILTVLEHGQPVIALLRYGACLILCAGTAVLMNRAGVLKKKIWYASILVLYFILFLIAGLC